jgi:hypothetical protein
MAKKRRRLFTVQTPLGYRVFIDRDRWRQILRNKHPAMTGREKEVRICLQQPTVVRESAKEPDVHMYYVTAENGHLCVVVAPAGTDERFVVTTYFTKNIKKGKELWIS